MKGKHWPKVCTIYLHEKPNLLRSREGKPKVSWRDSLVPSENERKKMKKLLMFLYAATLIVGIVGSANATPVNWINWTSTTSGNLTIGSQNVAVSMTGNPLDLVNGDYYYNNAQTGYTASEGTYGGLMPSDLIRVDSIGTYTLTFDSEIINPYISLVSVGRTNSPVSYNFSNPFSVISSGSNYWVVPSA